MSTDGVSLSTSLSGFRLRQYDIKALGRVVFEDSSPWNDKADVVVAVPLFNYGHTIVDCLSSICDQTVEGLSLVLVNDASTDEGQRVALDFLRKNRRRFSNVRLIEHVRNQGLAMTRNSAIVWSDEPFIFFLDADNRIRPPAMERLKMALEASGRDFAYSQLRHFGDVETLGEADVWDPERLKKDNYIDAMALVRRDALLSVGGFRDSEVEVGWEDYDMWVRLASSGRSGVFLPEVLCEYRVHNTSMLRTQTNRLYDALRAEMKLRNAAFMRPSVRKPEDDKSHETSKLLSTRVQA